MSIYRQARAAANTCPRCQDPLIAVPARAGVKLCAKCGGVFADVTTSIRILAALDRQLLEIGFQAALGKKKPFDVGLPLVCPECQMEMVKNRIESAACEIDACTLHGTWFDTGELVDVMRAFERARRKGIHLTHDRPSAPTHLELTEVPDFELLAFLEKLI